MELIKNNHIQIKYHTTFCFILAMCIFSIMTVSCRPSADRIPPRPKVDEFTKQHQYEQQEHQQQRRILGDSQLQKQQTEKNLAGTITTTDESSLENNPYGDLHPDKVRQIRKCNDNLDLMELCMRCAKVTKSPIVYPMCCDNEDNVKSWCEDYVYFGINST